ncbi:hypothetical protein IJJ08_01310 [bacterium]|nr:hypothetical protein [bacterium]
MPQIERKRITRAQKRMADDPLLDSRVSDLQIRALGRWNEQMSERVITRQNGYASYSMLKLIMNRNIAG